MPRCHVFFCELHHTLRDLGTVFLGDVCGGEGKGLWPGTKAAIGLLLCCVAFVVMIYSNQNAIHDPICNSFFHRPIGQMVQWLLGLLT